MNPPDLDQLSRDPRFIPGIYNYCDRWCERCPLSHRCLTFAMEQEWSGGDPEARDLRNQKFWDRLHEIFALTLDLVRQDALKRGVNLDAPDPEMVAWMEARQARREASRNHPLTVGSLQYARDIAAWLRQSTGAFEARLNELETQVRLEIGQPVEEGTALRDWLEVIQWYHAFIHAKLARAVESAADEDAEGPEVMGDQPRDSDGSAKVALIAIDRSLAAWTALREQLPEQGDGILDFQVLLARLRQGAEGRFPEARAFRRPGFDDAPAAAT